MFKNDYKIHKNIKTVHAYKTLYQCFTSLFLITKIQVSIQNREMKVTLN